MNIGNKTDLKPERISIVGVKYQISIAGVKFILCTFLYIA
jgi:hypothetical protein